MDNLEIYNRVRAVPKEAQKSFNNGSFSGTDINPMWRLMTLTKEFGPCGKNWYYTIEEHWKEEINGEVHTHVIVNLYVKFGEEWSKPIVGVGGNKSLQQFKSGPKSSDEGYKMALTDALGVAAKALGIGADIYYQNDPTKYNQEPYQEAVKEVAKPKAENVQPTVPKVQKSELDIACEEAKNAKSNIELTAVWLKWKDKFKTEAKFVKIIQTHPHNPNRQQNG